MLPTYNESLNLPLIIPEIFSSGLKDTDVLIIDDNSPDGTGGIADELSSANPKVSVMHRPSKMGLGSAYVNGFEYALKHGYEAVIQMDCDFSHSPQYLPALFAGLKDADCVIGSRYIPQGGIRGWPMSRQVLSRFANFYARMILTVDLKDLTGGFRCFRTKVLEPMDYRSIFSEGYAFQIEFNYRLLFNGFRVKEIPIIFADRTLGKSKISFAVILEAVFIVWKLRFLQKRQDR